MTLLPPASDPTGESHVHGGGDAIERGCAEAVAEIYGFLDGELDDQVMVQIEAHLRRCSPCLEAYDFESELRRVIVARCSEQIPPDLRERFCRMLHDLGAGGTDVVGVPAAPEPS